MPESAASAWGSASSRRASDGSVSGASASSAGRLLQGPPLGRRQTVEPGLQHADQGRRHLGRQQFLAVEPPDLAPGLDGALVDQHLDQFFHVERVALGPARHQLAQGRRNLRQLLQQLVGELAAEVLAERRQVDPLVLCRADPFRPALEQGRPGQAHD
jgi:hypothetical protein